MPTTRVAEGSRWAMSPMGRRSARSIQHLECVVRTYCMNDYYVRRTVQILCDKILKKTRLLQTGRPQGRTESGGDWRAVTLCGYKVPLQRYRASCVSLILPLSPPLRHHPWPLLLPSRTHVQTPPARSSTQSRSNSSLTMSPSHG